MRGQVGKGESVWQLVAPRARERHVVEIAPYGSSTVHGMRVRMGNDKRALLLYFTCTMMPRACDK